MGVLVQVIPCRLVSLLLARVSLGGSGDVDNIRQIKQVRELLGFSPPGYALLGPCAQPRVLSLPDLLTASFKGSLAPCATRTGPEY